MIGRTLGSYRIVEQIGAGGMATVYKAYDPGTDRYVAIKILPEHFFNDPTFRQRFEREAKAIARLEHIHILPIFAYGEDEGIAYLVMRYMQAGTLAERIGHGPLSYEEISRLMEQIASALDYAHKHGVLHRDVKPSNVLIDADGNAFLTDFGIAKMVGGNTELTGSGLIGTPFYMSPEQCQAAKNLTPASDQYSLGIVLYEMLTGRKPYQAETPVAVILMHLNDPLPSPCSLRPDITEDIERVLFKALAKQPELRFASCLDMASALAAAIPARAVAIPQLSPGVAEPGEPVTARILDEEADRGTIPLARPSHKAVRRGPPAWAVGLIALAALGLIAGAATLAGLFGRLQGATTARVPGPTATPTEMLAPTVVAPIPQGVRTLNVCGGDHAVCIETLGTRDAPVQIDLEMTVMSAAWGPDGQILVTGLSAGGDPSRDTAVYIMNPDGSGRRALKYDRNNIWAVWSPDGQWIAMHSDGALAIIRPEGSDIRKLWQEIDLCAFAPQWSPDSQRVVFSSDQCGHANGAPHSHEVLSVGLDGAVVRVVKLPPTSTCPDLSVAFSPDGRQVAYVNEFCHPQLIGADGSGADQPLADFPLLWTGSKRPQWGG